MEVAFIFGNQYNESGAVQPIPGKKGEQPLAPTKPFDAAWGYSLVLSPAPAGRHTIAHGNAVGMRTGSGNPPFVCVGTRPIVISKEPASNECERLRLRNLGFLAKISRCARNDRGGMLEMTLMGNARDSVGARIAMTQPVSLQPIPGKKGERPLAPTKPFNAT